MRIAILIVASALAIALAPAAHGGGRCGDELRVTMTLRIGGVPRSALVDAPPAARPLPVVVAFHGAGETGPEFESQTRLTALGHRAGFVSVYPTAWAKYWNDSGHGEGGDNDVYFVRRLLDRVERLTCVDAARVYATGVSNGGGFVVRLGCQMSDRLAAIAPVAGVYGIQPLCRPRRPVSLLEIHGTADRSVPYRGWGPHGVGSVAALLRQWRHLDGCPTLRPLRHRYAPRALLTDSYGCAGRTTVAAIALRGGVHTWPGYWSGPPAVDVDVSATDAVWRFFACSRRASTRGPGCPPPPQ